MWKMNSRIERFLNYTCEIWVLFVAGDGGEGSGRRGEMVELGWNGGDRLDFMRPFGCPVTILITLDPLGKFEGKADEGFLVGYSVTSKAFRVFNTKTRKVEENLHATFLKNKPNVTGKGPNWIFDIDSLTNSMNYIPVSTGNQTNKNAGPQDTNGNAGTKDNVDAGKEVSDQHYIMLPLWFSIFSTYKSSDDKAEDDKPKDDTGSKTVVKPINKEDQAYIDELGKLMRQEKKASDASDSLRTFSAGGPSSPHPDAFIPEDTLLHVDQDDSQIPDLEDTAKLRSTGIFTSAYDDDLDTFTSLVQSVGAEADFKNIESSTVVSHILTHRVHIDHLKDQILGDPQSAIQTKRMAKKNGTQKVAQALNDESWVEAMQDELMQFILQKKDVRGIVVRNKARMVAQGHRQEEWIDYDEVFALVPRIKAIEIFLAFALYMGFIVYQMDVKSVFLYGIIEEEVYVSQPPGFIDPQFPNKVYRVEKALYGLHQASKAWYETLFTFLLHNGYRRGIINKTLFIKTEKNDIMLVQVYVDDIISGSTKKSLCDEFEASMHKIFHTPIETQKPLVKDEEAADVDVHLYRSMIRSLMYLTTSRPDIMFAVCTCSKFQCKKQTIVATSITKAEYVAAANCYGQTKSNVEFHQIVDFLTSSSIYHALTIHATIDGKTVVITESSVRRDLLFIDDNGITCLTYAQFFENLPLMGQTLKGTGFPHTRGPNFPDPSVDVEAIHKEEGDSLVRAAITASLDVQQDSSNIAKTQSKATLNEPTPHGDGGQTPGSDEGSMTLKELTILCITLSQKSSRISSFHPFRAGTSRRLSLGRRSVSKPRMKNLKSQQKFQDTDDLVDEEDSGEKGGSTSETVSAARPYISAARPKVCTTALKTPPTTTTLFDDKYVTIDDTLIQTDLDEEARIERERQEKASKAALAGLYDEVQAQIDVDHYLAARLTHEEQEMYTVEERSKLLAGLFDRRKKHLAKKRAEAIRSKPPIKTQLRNLTMTYLKHRGSEEDEKRVGSRKKRVASSSSKQNSPKKQKSNEQESVDSDTELRKCLKVVSDDDKAIDYETLDVKTPIVDCESQVQGTMDVGDVHVYKLTRLDESYRHFLTFSRMFKVLDRQDVLDLHKIVMKRFPANDSEGYDLILWGDLKTLMKSREDDEIWRNQQD
nr:hypothetical protein [Tanacetum cinerariifolium]